MVHHKDKRLLLISLIRLLVVWRLIKEDVVLASADFVAGGDCADFAKTVHTAAHFHMAAVPDMVNDMYDLLVAAVADTAQLFADAAHFEKILLPRLPVPLSSPLPHFAGTACGAVSLFSVCVGVCSVFCSSLFSFKKS